MKFFTLCQCRSGIDTMTVIRRIRIKSCPFVFPVYQIFACIEEITGYFAIAAGALTWWLGITYFVNKVRTKFNLRGIWILNRVIGSIVMLVSVAGLIYTLLGESIY